MMGQVLAISGRVLPVTNADVQLEAVFENGARVVGESNIFDAKKRQDCRIHHVSLLPARPKALPDALEAIQTVSYTHLDVYKRQVLCLVGLALMTLSETLKPAVGDVICLFAAVFYSVDLMITERAVADERVDPLALGVCDLAVVGVVISVLSVFLETPALPGTAKVWAASLFLGIVCSGIFLVIQSVFQRHTTASRASLIFTLEPVFSAIFAFFLLGERIGVRGYLGAALMLASLVLVEVDGGALFKKGKKEAE